MSDTKPNFGLAIAQLRLIAITSTDNALTEGPVNADRVLLDLCADALHSLVHADRDYEAGRAQPDQHRYDNWGLLRLI
jgi:hypothetical protein